MSAAELLRLLATHLERAGIPFMLTGSVAAAFHGFELEGTRLWVATLEDLIIAKLEWAKLGASTRQIEDVTAMLRVAAGDVDRAYVGHWIAELGLDAPWQAAQALLRKYPARLEDSKSHSRRYSARNASTGSTRVSAASSAVSRSQ
jgi:hypothetical protein